MKRTLLAIAMLLVLPAAARAQSAEAEVMAVVDRLFDAMRARDTATMRSLFTPDARLIRGRVADGKTTLEVTAMSDFIENIAGAPPGLLLDEKLYAPEVRIDGNLATVWTFYTFHAGDRFSHCGVDAIQMIRFDDSWKMVHLADTARRENCDPPAGG